MGPRMGSPHSRPADDMLVDLLDVLVEAAVVVVDRVVVVVDVDPVAAGTGSLAGSVETCPVDWGPAV